MLDLTLNSDHNAYLYWLNFMDPIIFLIKYHFLLYLEWIVPYLPVTTSCCSSLFLAYSPSANNYPPCGPSFILFCQFMASVSASSPSSPLPRMLLQVTTWGRGWSGLSYSMKAEHQRTRSGKKVAEGNWIHTEHYIESPGFDLQPLFFPPWPGESS